MVSISCGDAAQCVEVASPCGTALCGCSQPCPWALADKAFADFDQSGLLKCGELLAEDRVADLEVVPEYGKLQLFSLSQRSQNGEPHRMGKNVGELVPGMDGIDGGAHRRASLQAQAVVATVINAAARTANHIWPVNSVVVPSTPATQSTPHNAM